MIVSVQKQALEITKILNLEKQILSCEQNSWDLDMNPKPGSAITFFAHHSICYEFLERRWLLALASGRGPPFSCCSAIKIPATPRRGQADVTLGCGIHLPVTRTRGPFTCPSLLKTVMPVMAPGRRPPDRQ